MISSPKPFSSRRGGSYRSTIRQHHLPPTDGSGDCPPTGRLAHAHEGRDAPQLPPDRYGDRCHLPFFPGAGHACLRPSGWQALRAAPHGYHQGPATSAIGGGVEETLHQGCGTFGIQQHHDFPEEIVPGGGCPVRSVLQGFYGRPCVSLRLGGSVFLAPAAGGSSSLASLTLSIARRRRRSSTSARNRTSRIRRRCPFSSTSWACPT